MADLDTYCVKFLLGDEKFAFGAERLEGLLNLITRGNILCLSTDHEGHVLLQRDETIPVFKEKTTNQRKYSVRTDRIVNWVKKKITML